MPVDYEAMGRRIRRKRQEMGLTQIQFAKRINLSSSYYGHIERGSRVPSLETLILIANELHVGTDQLLRDSLVVPVKLDKNPFFNAKDLHLLRAYLSVQNEALNSWLDEAENDSEDAENEAE